MVQRLNLREGSVLGEGAPAWAPVTLSSESSESDEASSADEHRRGEHKDDDEDQAWRKRRGEQRSLEVEDASSVTVPSEVLCPSALELLPPPGLGDEFSRELADEMREELELSRLRQSLIEQTLRSRILQVL